MGSCVSTSKTGTVVQTAHILPSTQPAKPKRTPEVNVVTPVAHHQVDSSRPVATNRRKSSGRNNEVTPTHNYFEDRKTPSPISDKPTNVIEVKPMVEKKNVEVQVANPPDRAKDDSSISSRNGQLARTGSLTVLKRSNSRPKPLNSRTPSEISIDSDSQIYASVDLGLEKLPPIDTPEASHVCSIRLRYILKRLAKDDIAKDDLVKNLEYAASVLETVYIDETREESPCRPYGSDDRGTNLAPSLSDGICDKPVIDSLSYRLHPNSHQSRRTNRRRRFLVHINPPLTDRAHVIRLLTSN